jgi:general secretion pathway protein G
MHRKRAGFTFVELMVVITIIVMIITLAVPMYVKAMLRSKESVLKSNIFTLQTQIEHYICDKQKAPKELQDLVSEGYLREIPVDPMTGSNLTWKVVQEDPEQAVDQAAPGIFAVRSGSDKIGLDGTPYADWQ